MNQSYDFHKVAKELEKYLTTGIKTTIGVEAVNFFRNNFMLEGFLDSNLEAWEPLSKTREQTKKKGSRILTDSGDLKRSISWEPTSYGVLIYTDEPYAEIHNEGGTIKGIFHVREHQRNTRKGRIRVRAHDRRVNTEIPQRRFIGESKKLKEAIEAKIQQHIHLILDKGQ